MNGGERQDETINRRPLHLLTLIGTSAFSIRRENNHWHRWGHHKKSLISHQSSTSLYKHVTLLQYDDPFYFTQITFLTQTDKEMGTSVGL